MRPASEQRWWDRSNLRRNCSPRSREPRLVRLMFRRWIISLASAPPRARTPTPEMARNRCSSENSRRLEAMREHRHSDGGSTNHAAAALDQPAGGTSDRGDHIGVGFEVRPVPRRGSRADRSRPACSRSCALSQAQARQPVSRGQPARDFPGSERLAFDVILTLDDDVEPTPGLVTGHAVAHSQMDRVLVLGYMPVVPIHERGHRSSAVARIYSESYERACTTFAGDPGAILLGLSGGHFSLRRRRLAGAAAGARGSRVPRRFRVRFAATRSWRARVVLHRASGRSIGIGGPSLRTRLTLGHRA